MSSRINGEGYLFIVMAEASTLAEKTLRVKLQTNEDGSQSLTLFPLDANYDPENPRRLEIFDQAEADRNSRQA